MNTPMNRRVIPGTDLSVSPICYGVADVGHDMDDALSFRLLDIYREAGGNFLDTAHVYAAWTSGGSGSSECVIRRYLQSRGRGDVVIATKGGHPSMPGYRKTDRHLSPGRIHADIEDSLGRLDLDRLDLYYLHRDDTRCGVDEVIDMLNKEIQAGTIRYLGASNWTKERIRDANAYAESKGLQGFVISEIEFALAHKETPAPEPHGTQSIYAQKDDIAFHEATGLALCAYTATARGYFADGVAKRADFDTPASRERLARAQALAAQKGCTPTQLALAWLIHQKFPCFPITGSVTPRNLEENLGAAAVSLEPGEVRWLFEG